MNTFKTVLLSLIIHQLHDFVALISSIILFKQDYAAHVTPLGSSAEDNEPYY